METERKRDMDRDNEDRISKLPEFLIHQVLSYLPPKEAARTTALSKTWLQSYSTFPFLTFDESLFERSDESSENKEERYPFFNFIKNTLLRYTRLNLRIQMLKITLSLGVVGHDEAYRLLDDSLGVAFDNGVQDLNITALTTCAMSPHTLPYTLPLAMFDSPKLLTYLRVEECIFPQNVSKCSSINFPFLKTLVMCRACIDDGMLQKLLSSSPSLEKIVFFFVSGFKKFRVSNLGKLKILDIHTRKAIVIDVEDAPCLRLCKYWSLSERPCWLKVGCSLQSLNLKRLDLLLVSISDNCLKDLVAKSPLLEDLKIDKCDELERVYILSSSLRHLDFICCKMLVEATIDAPNLLELRYVGKNTISLSLNNTPDELKTFIRINNSGLDHLNNEWFKQLRKLLKAVNQARVYFRIWSLDQGIEVDIAHDSKENPLPLEHQHQTENLMSLINHSSSLFSVFVETLFSSSRPATIGTCLLNNVEFVKFLRNELMTTTRNPDCCTSVQTKCWRHYLEDIKVEVFEDSQKVWQTLPQKTSLSEFTFCGQSIRFSLKWSSCL